MAGGNSGGGVTSFLPIAAALAATVATDGAASPWLVDAMGSSVAAGALTSGAAAAAASGITAALTGQNVGRAALMGGVTGGIGGGMGTAAVGGEGTALSWGGGAATPTIANAPVSGILSTPTPTSALTSTSQYAPEFMSEAVPSVAPETGVTGDMARSAATGGAQVDVNGLPINSGPAPAPLPPGTAPGGIGSTLMKMAPYALGATALGALITADNKKYGVPSPASQKYSGPLTDFHYSRENYTPLTAAQPSPAYQPKYANYVAQPYNASAAEGGQVHSYADGGLLQGGPANVDFMGSDMYPTSQQHRSYYATPTQAPVGAQEAMASYEPNTNPLTGQMTAHMAAGGIARAKRYAEGGATETKPADNAAQAPSLVDFAPFAGRYGVNEVPTQNAVAQDLVSRLAIRNAMNPVPNQTPPVVPAQPAGIMAATPYTPPAFTRPEVAPIQFQNPMAIRGTAEWNTEQQRLAAEEAARQAAVNPFNPFSSSPNNGEIGGGSSAAAGGLLHSYASGGKTASNMAAIDDYMAQYQSDPASVVAKAKAGDWNAMIAMNKIKSTPNQNYAHGGNVSTLGGYAAGGNPRLLKGPGDGMSDNIPATIGGKQPARLADGEFVVPADVVSHLGNGSTDAGAKHLYAMMDKVRKARTGNKKQGKQIKADKFLKA